MNERWRVREFGRIGEEILERWVLARKGCIISTSRSTEGSGAAMVDTETERWIRQDLLVAIHNRPMFVDAKTKERAPFNRNRGHCVTGCALRNYEHYLRIQQETGIPGALAFIQYEEKVMLFGYLDDIWPNSHVGEDGYTTIYFDVANFDRYKLQDQDWELLSKSAAVEVRRREWEVERHQQIAREVASEWKQRTLGFGGGGAYR